MLLGLVGRTGSRRRIFNVGEGRIGMMETGEACTRVMGLLPPYAN